MIGPAIAGLVIAAVGTGLCFVLNAVSFLAVLAALALVRDEELHPVEKDRRRDHRRRPRRAFAFAWADPQLRSILGVVTVVRPWASTSTCSSRCSPRTRSTSARGIRPPLGIVRPRRARRRAHDRDVPRGELASVLDRDGVVRRARAAAGAGSERYVAGCPPLRDRDLVHALHGERERARAARRARPPPRPAHRPLPLRVRRSRTGRRALRRLAGETSAERRSPSRSPGSRRSRRSVSRTRAPAPARAWGRRGAYRSRGAADRTAGYTRPE